MPTVSVIMPTYNSEHYVEATIRSVLAQSFTDFELIAVDDGSSDGTIAAIQRFRDPRIRILSSSENHGVACASNIGIRAASAPYIAALGSDDFWTDTKLEEQLAVFHSRPEIDVIFTWIRYVDADGAALPFIQAVDLGDNPLSTFLTRHVDFSSSLLIRRRCFDVCGLLDERLRHHEDWDFWIRLCLEGMKFAGMPKVLTARRLRAGGLTFSGIGTHDLRVLCEKMRALAQDPSFSADARVISQSMMTSALWMAGIGRHGTALEFLRQSFRFDGNRLWDRVFHKCFFSVLTGMLKSVVPGPRSVATSKDSFERSLRSYLSEPRSFNVPSSVS